MAKLFLLFRIEKARRMKEIEFNDKEIGLLVNIEKNVIACRGACTIVICDVSQV